MGHPPDVGSDGAAVVGGASERTVVGVGDAVVDEVGLDWADPMVVLCEDR